MFNFFQIWKTLTDTKNDILFIDKGDLNVTNEPPVPAVAVKCPAFVPEDEPLVNEILENPECWHYFFKFIVISNTLPDKFKIQTPLSN